MSNALEIIDALCDTVEQLADVVRGQAVLIEQAKTAGVAFSDDLFSEPKASGRNNQKNRNNEVTYDDLCNYMRIYWH